MHSHDHGSLPHRPQPLQVWGGVECTIVRVHDMVRDQIRETGHYEREDDLDLIAGLGIRTLRYPVLWEAVAPLAPDHMDWDWHDRRLTRLRDLGIRPIIGLVHHGSGPSYANYYNGGFAEGLANFAAAVASRYPWVDMFTPVNEPLTTARFSGLYGHWFPHLTTEAECFRILVEECLGIVMAMRKIRHINPDAQLVQTEDLGRIFASPVLSKQAEYENTRRWLSLDLISGLVDGAHPMFGRLLAAGIPQKNLDLLVGEARPIDIIGINHYLTSDRYLDEHLELFPPASHGGNGRQRYADVEAFRVDIADNELGPEPRLREAWERYHRPVAMSEVHNGATEDEQVRWLMECWSSAEKLRLEGADIRAITVWSLFGSVDWHCLLTQQHGHREGGAFEFQNDSATPTLLATAIRALALDGTWSHPVLAAPGWWRRASRTQYSLRPAA